MIEPASVDEGIGLSEPVAAVVDRAAQAVVDLVGDLLDEEDPNDQVAAGGRDRGGGGGGRHPGA